MQEEEKKDPFLWERHHQCQSRVEREKIGGKLNRDGNIGKPTGIRRTYCATLELIANVGTFLDCNPKWAKWAEITKNIKGSSARQTGQQNCTMGASIGETKMDPVTEQSHSCDMDRDPNHSNKQEVLTKRTTTTKKEKASQSL